MNAPRKDFLQRLAALRAGLDGVESTNRHHKTLRLPDQTIEHSAFLKCAATIADVHIRHLEGAPAQSAHISGQSGCGKSRLRDWYCERNPVEIRRDFDRIPVIAVETPAKPTVKNLVAELLRALGWVQTHRHTENEMTNRLYYLLKQHKVELIIIDEFHHFLDHRTGATSDVTDWLKLLVNSSKLPVVLIGLPRSELIIQSNEQMARRFSRRCTLTAFSAATDESWLEFRSVLRELHRQCPIPAEPFHDPDIARRFLFATEGLIDFAVRLLNGAISIAHLSNCEIKRDILAKAFVEQIWHRAPDDLNPFIADGELRSLRQPGEPFASWDKYDGGARHDS